MNVRFTCWLGSRKVLGVGKSVRSNNGWLILLGTFLAATVFFSWYAMQQRKKVQITSRTDFVAEDVKHEISVRLEQRLRNLILAANAYASSGQPPGEETVSLDARGLRWRLMVLPGAAMLSDVRLLLNQLAPVLALSFGALVPWTLYMMRKARERSSELELSNRQLEWELARRREAEEELAVRARQQAAVAELGQRALAGENPHSLMQDSVATVAQTLQVQYCELLELLPDKQAFLLRAGVGWKDGCVGKLVLERGTDTHATYAMLSSEPVVVHDFHSETRFVGSSFLLEHGVLSGIRVVIHGKARPFGILGAHTSMVRSYSQDDVHFLQAIGNILMEVMERAAVEEARRRLVAILEATTDFIGIADVDGRLFYGNRALRNALGLREGEQASRAVIYGHQPEWARNLVRGQGIPTTMREGVWQGETALLTFAGEQIPVSQVILAHKDPAGEVEFLSTIMRDITVSKRAERQLRLQAAALESAANAILITDREGVISWVNRAFTKLTGYAAEEVIGRHPNILKSAMHEVQFYDHLWETILSGRVWQGEIVNRRKDGGLYHEEMTITPVRDDGGEITHFIAIKQDISERKQAEEEVGRLNRALTVLSKCNEAVVRATEESQLLNVVCQILVGFGGYRFAWVGFAEQDENRTVCPVAHAGYEEGYLSVVRITWADTEWGRGPAGTAIRMGKVCVIRDTQRNPGFLPWRAEAKQRGYHSVACIPLIAGRETFGSLNIYASEADAFDSKETELLTELANDLAYGIAALRARTARKQAEETLRQAEEKYRGMFEDAVVGIFQTTPEGRYLSVNRALARICGYDSPEQQMAEITDIGRQVYVDPQGREEYRRRIEEGEVVRDFEYQVYRRDGSKIWLLESARAVRDGSGRISYYEGTVEDITERKLLEAQLRQAQKMEAIGQLAGGVAHDFNNILMVITSYVELLGRKHPEAASEHRYLSEIRKAAGRAATMTHRLLAFSRKQELLPQVTDLNALLAEQMGMLKGLLGEDIALTLSAGVSLGHVKVDRGQIEQVVLNLAANSRDAMPRGGKLVIETANVELDEHYVREHAWVTPGRYVMLAVSDTGCGMDEQTKARVFEPFFTTKEKGKGTGLGLATVYGIVKQSGGHISVYSQPGVGTTFKIHLPRVEEPTEGTWVSPYRNDVRGSETILLVEDEEAIRESLAEHLKDFGYTVLKAQQGMAALKICQEYNRPIHLMLTDVVMPEMSGRELFAQIQSKHPETKVIYMSGYTNQVLALHGALESGSNLLHKPFDLALLGQRIRQLLDSEPAS